MTIEDLVGGKLKYPKSVFFIFIFECFERFNFYGLRTILSIYMTSKLGMSEHQATNWFHVYIFLVYFAPIFGGLLADSWLGKFKTIFILSIVYLVGGVIVTAGSVKQLNLPATAITAIGLFLFGFGAGSINPCVVALGGDQFTLPQQAKQLARFFSIFYFSINLGSVVAMLLTPILRSEVACLGEQDCYPLAFGVVCILLATAIIFFSFGKVFYTKTPPSGNMLCLVCCCIGNAIKTKIKERKTNPKQHLLDYSVPKYDPQLVEDIRRLGGLIILYLPFPVFWALFFQQGSRWNFQATRMNGETAIYDIKPEQIQAFNAFFILLLIPLFEYAIYPLLRKCGIKKPCRLLAFGGILAGFAFVFSAFVQLKLEEGQPQILKNQEVSFRIVNSMPCGYTITSNSGSLNHIHIDTIDTMIIQKIDIGTASKTFHFNFVSDTPEICQPVTGDVKLPQRKTTGVLLRKKGDAIELQTYEIDMKLPKAEFVSLSLLSNMDDGTKITFSSDDSRYTQEVLLKDGPQLSLHRATYDIYVGKQKLGRIDAKTGGIYTVLIIEDKENNIKSKVFTTTEPTTLSILWQIPQYLIITAGEVMFGITGLSFSYSQAPDSMKSVIQALWLICTAFGNVLVVLITEIQFFELQSNEFFLFGGLMFADMAIFIILAYRYKTKEVD